MKGEQAYLPSLSRGAPVQETHQIGSSVRLPPFQGSTLFFPLLFKGDYLLSPTLLKGADHPLFSPPLPVEITLYPLPFRGVPVQETH